MNRREFAQAVSLVGAMAGASEELLGQAERKEDERGETAGRVREPFHGDPHRPRYHFLPQKNWMNDPNGLIFYKGWYHLFYQYNPGAAVWGNMHWGHAVSRDLLNWQHLPIAMAPMADGYDKDGVFSGCAVVNGEEPTIVYTGTQPEVQAIATSTHRLLETWTKYARNPVIVGPPKSMEVTGFRDPCVWREGDEWLMALGCGIKGRGGMVLLYRSPDLRKWEYLHPLVESNDPALGTMWECPSFFPLGNKHVLILSPVPLRKSIYAIGTYRDRRFAIETVTDTDSGGHFYAPQTFLDAADRRVMFGWSWEGRSREAQVNAGWAGAQTLPRVLSLDPSGKLRMEPHPLCQRLLRFGKAVRSMPLGDALNHELAAQRIAGDAGRLDVVLSIVGDDPVTVAFYRSPDGVEETRLIYRPGPGELVIDRTKSSLSPSQETKEHIAQLPLAKGEPLNLSLYFDRSLVEIYANGTCCMTTRVYPTRSDSIGMQVTGGSEKCVVRELRWRPISLRVS